MSAERILEAVEMDVSALGYRGWMFFRVERKGFPLSMSLAHRDQIVRFADLGYRTGVHWKPAVFDIIGTDMLPGVANAIRATPNLRPDAWRVLKIGRVWHIDFVEVIVAHRPGSYKLRAYRQLFDACRRGKRIVFECWKADEFGTIGPLVTAETRGALWLV